MSDSDEDNIKISSSKSSLKKKNKKTEESEDESSNTKPKIKRGKTESKRVDLSDEDNDEDNSERKSRFGSKKGINASKLNDINNGENDEDEDNNESDEDIYTTFLKLLCKKNNIKYGKKRNRQEYLKRFFTELSSKMLLSLKIDPDEEDGKRAVDLLKLGTSKKTYLMQKSPGNICMKITKFPDSLDNKSKAKVEKFERDEEFNKKDYIVCLTSKDIKELGGDSDKYHYTKKISKFIISQILEYCDEDVISKLHEKKGKIETKAIVLSNELVDMTFSEDEKEETFSQIKQNERVQQVKERIKSYEPKELNQDKIIRKEEVFEDIYDEIEEDKEIFNFSHSTVPCSICKVVDVDTFDLLCSFQISDFARVRGSRTYEEEHFIIKVRSKLCFLSIVGSWTLPGASLVVAFENLVSYIKERKIHCFVSFRGEDSDGSSLAEVYINGRGIYQTLTSLNMGHPNEAKEALFPIIGNWNETTTETLSSSFKRECPLNSNAREEFKQTDLVQEIAEKITRILKEAFFSETPLDEKALGKLGKSYNKEIKSYYEM